MIRLLRVIDAFVNLRSLSVKALLCLNWSSFRLLRILRCKLLFEVQRDMKMLLLLLAYLC